MKAHVFAIVNQKGGIGKTTTAVHLAVGLRNKGYKTLLIDMDAQCNLTFTLNGDYQNKPTIMDAILNEAEIFDTIQYLEEIDLIPGSNNLSSLDTMLDDDGKEYFLADCIEKLKSEYDYIVIDSPPALSLISVGIMCAANSLIVPVGVDMYSLQGTGQLFRTYSAVKEYCNEDLKIDGILINKDSLTLRKVLVDIAKNLKINIFNTTISYSPIITHAVIDQKSVYKYAPNSKPCREYDQFIDELLNMYKKDTLNKDVLKNHDTSKKLIDALNEIGMDIDNADNSKGGN